MKEKSFSQRMDEGWPRAQLQDHYCLTDNEFDRVCACLENIRKGIKK